MSDPFDPTLSQIPPQPASSSVTGTFGDQVSGDLAETNPAASDSETATIPTPPPGYEIECELGRGGMGVVFRGRHPL